jgi:hypothetical protein
MPDGSNLATSDDVFAGVDWDSVTAQLKQMGPPPRPPPFVGESDTVLMNQKSLDPVFNKDVDLAAPTEEDMKLVEKHGGDAEPRMSPESILTSHGLCFCQNPCCQNIPSCSCLELPRRSRNPACGHNLRWRRNGRHLCVCSSAMEAEELQFEDL